MMKPRMWVGAAAALACALLVARAAHATKPCGPSPCTNSSGQMERHQCELHADWIAQGTISQVVHHREGRPLNTDFAEFTFTVVRWEKTPKNPRRTFRFKVGWCDNRPELPADTSGLFRIFGLASKGTAPAAPRYIYLEPVANTGAP